MEGKPERVNVLVVGERDVDKGERADDVVVVKEEEEEERERRAELDALSKEALGFAEYQQTRGRTDDRLTREGIRNGRILVRSSELNEGLVFPH